MLVECLGTIEPLSVHKMDASRKLPTWEPEVILAIVQKVVSVSALYKRCSSSPQYVVSSSPARGAVAPYTRVKPAVDILLQLRNVQRYIWHKTQYQVNAFATYVSTRRVYIDTQVMPGTCLDTSSFIYRVAQSKSRKHPVTRQRRESLSSA